LKNSLVRLRSAIFESRRRDRQLFITLLGGSTNQSFAVYPPPDFFNNIDPKRTLRDHPTLVVNAFAGAVLLQGRKPLALSKH